MTEYTKGYKQEIPDPTPMEIPVGYRMPMSLAEQIKAMVRTQLSQQAEAQGEETFEEADDFEIDEDPSPISQYEMQDMAPEFVRERDASPPVKDASGKPVEAPTSSPIEPLATPLAGMAPKAS